MPHFDLITFPSLRYLKQCNDHREEAHKRSGENKRPSEHDWSSKNMGLPTKSDVAGQRLQSIRKLV